MMHLRLMPALLVVTLALPAWAVGERIVVSGANDAQVKELLCNSMECITAAQAKSGGYSATVESVAVKGAIELKVSGADGVVRTTQKVPVNDDGRVSSTELVSATSVMVNAIENPTAFKKAEKAEKGEKSDKTDKKVASAKKHSHKPVQIAARGHNSRG